MWTGLTDIISNFDTTLQVLLDV